MDAVASLVAPSAPHNLIPQFFERLEAHHNSVGSLAGSAAPADAAEFKNAAAFAEAAVAGIGSGSSLSQQQAPAASLPRSIWAVRDPITNNSLLYDSRMAQVHRRAKRASLFGRRAVSSSAPPSGESGNAASTTAPNMERLCRNGAITGTFICERRQQKGVEEAHFLRFGEEQDVNELLDRMGAQRTSVEELNAIEL